MKKENIYKIIIGLLLMLFLVGVYKYFYDTNKLKSELGLHYELAIVDLLDLEASGLKEHLQNNGTLDAQFLKSVAHSYEHHSENIDIYYGLNKISILHAYGFNVRNKLRELADLIESNTDTKRQNELKEEIISILDMGQETLTYISSKIDSTTSNKEDYSLNVFKTLHNPSQELKNKVNKLLPGFE